MNRRGFAALAVAAVVVLAASVPGSLTSRVELLEQQVAALTTRVAALEAQVYATPEPTPSPIPSQTPTPVPIPTPTPSPTPAPACPANLQAAIDATPAGGSLALGTCAYTATISLPRAITLTGGRLTAPASGSYVVRVSGADVTIDGLTVSGGKAGIWADSGVRLVVRRSTVTDASYAGIMVLSGSHCTVVDNTVRRIGMSAVPGANAYGIALSMASGKPATTDCTVSGNTVTDVPIWHALDTHSGQRIAFVGNTVRNCSRAIFLTTSGTQAADLSVIGNRFERGTATYNLRGLTLSQVDRVEVTGNTVIGYGTAWWTDYGGGSTGVNVHDNTVTP
jgi:hypothetical protein